MELHPGEISGLDIGYSVGDALLLQHLPHITYGVDIPQICPVRTMGGGVFLFLLYGGLGVHALIDIYPLAKSFIA